MTRSNDSLPLISIVVPSYNQGHFLPDTLQSIFEQEYPRLEVVVIDGGSTDASVEVIRRYQSGIKFWRSERDAGQSAAINEGMRHCSGDLCAWLNSDDFYWDDCLWTVGKAYMRYPGRGLYIGNGLRYDQATGTRTAFNPRHMAMDREALLRGADFILQPATFFLREAWQRVGGLDENLRFCMDWDIFIRIAQQYPCLLINEFLGVSREYEDTKTRSGKLDRAFEIMQMIRRHTQLDATPGGMLYLFETLAGLTEAEGVSPPVRGHLHGAFGEIVKGLCKRHGRGLWFPARTDAQDDVYLPLAGRAPKLRSKRTDSQLPTISVVISGDGQDAGSGKTLESIQEQRCTSVEVIRVAPGAVAAAAGMQRASAQVLLWMRDGDLLADGAFLAAGRAFAKDPNLDIVCGNALHIDEHDELFLADHGMFDSGFWLGAVPPRRLPVDFHFEIYKTPRSAVYFRRELLDELGGPDPSICDHYCDVDFFQRLSEIGRFGKLDRTLALCRLSSTTYAADRQQLFADLYRFERLCWPGITERDYRKVLRRFVGNYMRWKFTDEKSRWAYRLGAVLAALAAVTRLGNPMCWWPARDIPQSRLERLKGGSRPATELDRAA